MIAILLVAVCALPLQARAAADETTGDVTVAAVQPPREGEVYSYPERVLTPVNTGRSVTFDIPQPDSPPRFAVKTNLAYWATLTPNLSVEAVLGKRTSLELAAGFNPWNRAELTAEAAQPVEGVTATDNKRLWHWSVRPEFRYWLATPFCGHYFGVSAVYIDYEIGGYKYMSLFEKENYYNGTAYGGSLSYGYHWRITPSWGVEFSVGVGAVHTKYDELPCDNCTGQLKTGEATYIGPTSLGIKMVFKIK